MEISPDNDDLPQKTKPRAPGAPAAPSLLSKHLNGKQREWDAIASHKTPLRLLDLPLDILQTILRELNHTNDLTSLALTHSALHALVIPLIYSRFDIVWPDANATFANRMGVDALTYGLATLVMAQDVFGESPHQQVPQHTCQSCGHQNPPSSHPTPTTNTPHIRRGNYFAQYTRKFGLGNGPADWVQEYLITKEAGKMLGTLVALAVGRMRNLESFVWDMPTGVLRDVWLALASLGNRQDGQPCRLERVWVRWHDNQDQGPLASPPPSSLPATDPSHLPSILAGHANALFQIPPYPRVEFPTFSILPPLKSLSVLDIDELPYAEEMSVLIDRSLGKLQELRVGMASHAQFDLWARPSEDRAAALPSLMSAAPDQAPRPGGIMGILVHRICPTFSHHARVDTSVSSTAQTAAEQETQPPMNNSSDKVADSNIAPSAYDINQLDILFSEHHLYDNDDDPAATQVAVTKNLPSTQTSSVQPEPHMNSIQPLAHVNKDRKPTRKLMLDTLEIERVTLSLAVMAHVIDWSRLNTLTLLGCRNHEHLWKALRKRYTPTSRRRVSSAPYRTSSRSQSSQLASVSQNADDYFLKLKRLHTDTVSPSLIAFIKDALAPDSLEWLFLQDNPTYKSSVTVDVIYRGAIRRHRASLTKLLIDSSIRTDEQDPPPDASWRRWVISRDLLTCITSGKMKLRELSMAIDYKDWHYFLRRLPHATTLRSLHITRIAEHVNGNVHSREAALQVLDIVALRPELELCYLGVQNQCFEILEYTTNRKPSRPGSLFGPNGGTLSGDDMDANSDGHPHGPSVHVHNGEYDDDEDGDSDDSSDFDGLSDSAGGGSDEEGDGGERSTAAKQSWRLREILFYDDKVSIFRARHGRL
ncbi:hypothetical protein PV10_06257 [Exophiala mesophila]|uniref:F-box domain-containing protein n=1 Tax=Exophiala mesophila TaxID=212818 RepID=A0A0D1WRI0_EXOME|nr:uncharacterized protein PV10_06257 [Exophiala mesophila]KIV91750.1 hypothetical protein PV10_06257 [Exophiala mesophila]